MRKPLTALAFALSTALAPNTATPAGIPVIDVTAIANLIEQITYWQQQMTAMAQQLHQLQQTHAAQTGDRGMQNVLPTSEPQRNYLPRDFAELMKTVNGTAPAYAGLSAQMQAAMSANAVLSNQQLAQLSPEVKKAIEERRRASAMLAATTQAAYQNTSQRFAMLQTLITMIAAAGDAKAIQDLQARVSAEQAMLTTEQTKLQTLYQIGQSQQLAHEQQVREQVISGHGGFASRFSPSP